MQSKNMAQKEWSRHAESRSSMSSLCCRHPGNRIGAGSKPRAISPAGGSRCLAGGQHDGPASSGRGFISAAFQRDLPHALSKIKTPACKRANTAATETFFLSEKIGGARAGMVGWPRTVH